MKKSIAGLVLALAISTPVLASPLGFTYETVWTHSGSGAEIVAYDSLSERFFVTNSSNDGLDVINARTGAHISSVSLGGSPNSVAIKNGIVAVAVEAPTKTDNGQVMLFNASEAVNGTPTIHSVTVGALPDMLTFTPDGHRIIVANEGEEKKGIDPNGTVSIVDISSGINTATVESIGFTAYDGDEAALNARGVRIFPNKTASQDLEPEYIALSKDGSKAFVTLQENNTLAIIDLNDTSKAPTLISLGSKDHSLPGQGIDGSDKDGVNQVNTFNELRGLYQPDAIASYNIAGKDFFITANEGDTRNEDKRLSKLTLDPTIFPNAAELQKKAVLGRLKVSSIDGDIDGDGDLDQLFSYGARSFSIFDEDGQLVWDSGDQIEQLIIDLFPSFWADGREDNKGPEPEGVAILQIMDHWLAFIGLERSSAVMVFDVTDPNSPFFIDLMANFGDVSPEGLLTLSSAESFDDANYLVVANEVSGTTTLYRVSIPEPSVLALFYLCLLPLGHKQFRQS